MNPTAPARPFRGLLTDVRSVAGRQLGACAALTLAGALAEGAGLLMLLPMLSLLSNRHGRVAERLGAILPPRLLLPAILVLFLLVMATRAAILLARDRSVARLENAYDVSLRLRVAVTLADRGWPAAALLGQAGMQNLLASAIPRSVTAIHYAIQLATAAFLLAVQLLLAAWLSWPLALAAIAILALGIPWLIALTRLGEASGEQMASGQHESTRAAYEFHAALKVALAQGSVADFIDAYHAQLVSLAGHYFGFASAMARSRATHSVGAAVAGVLIVGTGYALAIELPRLIALLILFSRMSGPAQGLQQSLGSLASYLPSFTQIKVALGELSPLHALAPPAAPLEWQSIAAAGLSLDRGEGGGLAPVDFALARGEWLALSGPSGAGKTTLIDIVAGLHRPTAGTLSIDGTSLDEGCTKAWHASLSYVCQQETPFEPTIRAALGDWPDERCWDALALAGLAEIIRATPAGLDTLLSERGARLSGGERQRLLIARALLRDPALLILDEATAALDVASERALVERLRAARPGMAVLLVAHRAESLGLCDRTLAINGGGMAA
jgi:ABC-type bacteriocin/lantibiotic exporter with double-glycine peptidase domain